MPICMHEKTFGFLLQKEDSFMFKNFLRILSLVLVVSLLWNMLPINVLGEEFRTTQSEDTESLFTETDTTLVTQESKKITILGELVERRTENIKEYLLSNGNTLAAVYGDPVHYQEDGEWKEIDNTLIAQNGTYVNTAGLLRVSFPENINSSNYITVTKDGYTLSFGMAGQLYNSNEVATYGASSRVLSNSDATETLAVSATKNASAQLHTVDFTEAKAVAKYPELVQEKTTSRLSYSNVYANTDITYDINSDRVKESVILTQYDATLRGYRYTLQTGGLIPVLADDGHIDFYDAKREKVILKMPAPFLVDANSVYNWEVDVTLTGSNSTYTLTYLLPTQWLAAEERAWPIVLDPVVEVESSASTIADQTVFSGGSQAYTWDYLQCGCDTAKAVSRIYLKFSAIPTLSAADVIVDATVSLYKPGSSSSPFYVDVHGVNGSWTSSDITWSNKPAFDTNATDFVMVKNAGLYSWDVTDLAREWYQTNTNYGMVFKASDTVEGQTGANNYVQFYSSDFETNTPQLTIEYRNTAGLEDYWDYTSASAGRAGTAYINNSAGNLVFVRNLMAFSGNRMPVSIDLVYNASDKNSDDYGVGNGWRTNYHQRVYADGTNYYVWEDSDGTRHYFLYDKSILEFKGVIVLADAHVVLHELRCDGFIVFGLGNNEFIKLACQAVKVSTDAVGNHACCLGINSRTLSTHIIGDERGQRALLEFLRLKESTHLINLCSHLLAAVERAILVAKDEHRRRLRLLQVVDQFVHTLQRLCLLDDDDLMFGHHGIALGSRYDATHISILAIDNHLVESSFLLGEHMLGNIVREAVYVVRLLAHEIVHGSKLPRVNLLDDAVVCDFLLCHEKKFAPFRIKS